MILSTYTGSFPASDLLDLSDCALFEQDQPEGQSALCAYAARFEQDPHYVSDMVDLSGERYKIAINP